MSATALTTAGESRGVVLDLLTSDRSQRVHELRISSAGLLALLRIAAAAPERVRRHEMLSANRSNQRPTKEDLTWLEQQGLIESSAHYLEMTDRGNALIREMVAFVSTWNGGGA